MFPTLCPFTRKEMYTNRHNKLTIKRRNIQAICLMRRRTSNRHMFYRPCFLYTKAWNRPCNSKLLRYTIINICKYRCHERRCLYHRSCKRGAINNTNHPKGSSIPRFRNVHRRSNTTNRRTRKKVLSVTAVKTNKCWVVT